MQLFLGLVRSSTYPGNEGTPLSGCSRVIIYLPDGPGNPTVTMKNVELAEVMLSDQPGSCVVLMDRRGTGGSGFLDCPKGSSVFTLESHGSCAKFIRREDTQRSLKAATYDFIAEDLALLARSLNVTVDGGVKITIVAVGDSALPAVAFLKDHPDGVLGLVERVLFDSPVSPDLGKRLRLERNQNLVAFATMGLCARTPGCLEEFVAERNTTGGDPMQALSMLRNLWDSARLSKYACEGMNVRNEKLKEECEAKEVEMVCHNREHDVREALALLMYKEESRNLLPAAVLRVLRCHERDVLAIKTLLNVSRSVLYPEIPGASELISANHNFGPLWKTLTEPSVSCFAMVTVSDAITVSTKRYSEVMCPARKIYFEPSNGADGVGYEPDYKKQGHHVAFDFINLYPENGTLSVKVAIVQGDLDAVVPLSETSRFRDSLTTARTPGASVEMLVVRNAAHVALQASSPPCLLEAATGFLHGAELRLGDCGIAPDFTGETQPTKNLSQILFGSDSLF